MSEIRHHDVKQALTRFFGEHFQQLPPFISGKERLRLNHMGLEIYTPLDLWLTLTEVWVSQLAQDMNLAVSLERTTRFPSSHALQTRVGAFVEIMCTWMKVQDSELVIELFDIQRPLRVDLNQTIESGWLKGDGNPADPWVSDSFTKDPIWHYAIDVQDQNEVEMIHDAFVKLALNHHDYRLAYLKPVYNRYDSSYHTKIIHQALAMELEFATHQPG